MKPKRINEDFIDEPWRKSMMEEKVKHLKYLPNPLQIVSLVMLLGILLVGLRYAPALVDWFMEYYAIDSAGKRNLFTASLLTNMGLFALLAIIFFYSGRVTMTWIKARIRNRPILSLWTKNKTIEFIIPEKVGLDVWTVNKEYAAIPDDSIMVRGPHGVTMMNAVPEYGTGFLVDFNPREMMSQIKLPNIDMTVIRQYATEFEQRANDMRHNSWEFLKPFIGPILLLAIIGLIFWPMASKRLSQDGTINGLQEKIFRYESHMAVNRCLPPELKETAEGPPTTLPVDGARPASAGTSVS